MRAKGLLDKQPHRRFRKAGLLGIYKPNGEMVVKTNGTRQKKQNTPKSRLDQQTFSDIVQAIKSPVDKDMIAAVRLQDGTTLLWRDILMMCAQGTLWTLRTPDGNLWLGARQLSQTIQNLLDSVSDVPGTILGRTGTGWQALLPGKAGYVLTSQGENSPPIYQPQNEGSSGGTESVYMVQSFTNVSQVVIKLPDTTALDFRLRFEITSRSGNNYVTAGIGDTSTPPVWMTTGNHSYGAGQQSWQQNDSDNFRLEAQTSGLGADMIQINAALSSNGTVMTASFTCAGWNLMGNIARSGTTRVGAMKFTTNSGTITGSYTLYAIDRD